MNIAMEQTEVSSEQMGRPSMPAWRTDVTLGLQEYVNGQLKNKYGDAFIRGNNGERTLHAGDWPRLQHRI